MVARSAQGTGRSALCSKGLKGLQTELMEEVGAGQKHGASALSMAGCTCFCWEARAAQCSQANGAVPDISLDNLSELETNNLSSLTKLIIFTPPVTEVCTDRGNFCMVMRGNNCDFIPAAAISL